MFTTKRCLILSVVLIAACYESPVPISTNARPLDAGLIGTWQTDAEEGNEQLSVLQFDNGYYYVEMPWDRGSSDTTRLRARAYVTDVAGTLFVNVQDIQGPERAYTFFKLMRHSETSLSLRPLKGLPKFASSAELETYLRGHRADSSIYDAETMFRRVSPR